MSSTKRGEKENEKKRRNECEKADRNEEVQMRDEERK
jgi:hypothetical protein